MRTQFRVAAAAAALLTVAMVTVEPIPAAAVEIPAPPSVFELQTSGPIGAPTLGDWYSPTVAGAGAGYHYLTFNVPCGWPAASPVYVDLFSPEMNRVSGALAKSEEPAGNYDSTQFELYGPGAVVGPGFASPAPGAGIPGTRITYEPGAPGVAEAWTRFATLAAPVTCGNYVVRSQVLASDPLNPGGTGDDQNGWKIRVGTDNDNNPTNAPPANYDNPDGVTGTNDEITIGAVLAQYQQDSGAVQCQTFYEYVNPGSASVTFHNFDMDGGTRLRYYAPGDPTYDATATTGGIAGTMSGNGIWNNGGTLATRVGDTIASPTPGWWRLVSCISTNNGYVLEGQTGKAMYYAQPSTPSMTLTKTDGVATASPGQALTYNITATNNSAGATRGAANNVVVTDTIPAGFTYTGCSIPTPAQGTWTCSQAAGVVTFTETTGWINAGANAVLRVTGTVNQGVSGTITNSATVNYTDMLGNPFAPVTGTDVDNIVASANLSIAKADAPDPVNPGAALVYTLTVNNAGPSNATNLVVSDTVPSQYTVTSVTSPIGACGNVGNVVTCNLAAFASGAAAWVITVNTTVKATTVGGTYVNTATVSATETDPTPANNTVNDNNTVRTTGDLSITKTDGVASVTVGSATTYTITVTNNGPDIEPAGVVITDNIPAGAIGSESEADCAIAAGAFKCTTAATLAVGASKSYQLTLTLPAGYALATLTNTATITTFPITDTNAANNAATDIDTVPQANLSIAKADAPDPVNPGAALVYTLTVNNAGPATASSLVVSDTVPAQYSVTSVTSPIGVCGNVGNVVTCTLASMNSGAAAWVITVNATANANTPGGAYVNTATVSSSTNDPTPANNTVNDTNTVRSVADLSITKTDGVASVTVGSSTTYTITVTNNGPTVEPAGIVITDNIPAGTNGSETEADCAIAAGAFKCTTTAALAVGASISYQLTLTLPAAYALATLTNTATITTFPILDLNAANNAATDVDTVPQANLSIVKTDSADPVNPGQAFNYTLTVNNAGPATASSLVVSDTVPAQYTVTSVTSPTGSCGNVGNVVTCTLASMNSGAPAWVITVNVSVKVTTPGGTYTNTATVSSSTNDPTPANNTANQNTTVAAFADLTLTKTDGVATVTAGTSTTYTITITNNGPSTEPAGVRFTDTIPAGTVGSETEADCAIAAGVFTCTTAATIASGATKSYQLTLAVPSGYAPATVVNTANITVRPITDPNLGNNSATDTDNVARSADLSITKTDSADPVIPGQAFTYTLTVTNNGPSDAATLTVSDTVPAQFTVTNVTAPTGVCGHAGNVVTCTQPTLLNAATWVITVSVTTSLIAPGGTYGDTATVSAVTADPTPANNSATQNTTVSVSADLAVTKTDGVASVGAGTSTTYTITLTNNGPSAVAAGVVVSDPIPAGTIGSETEPDCVIAAGTFTCTTSAVLASGGSVVYHLSLAVAAGYAPATLVNTASITSSPATDPTPANNSDTDTDTVTKSADLSITKSNGVATVIAGTSTTYTITITNNGPSIEPAGAVVSDPIPAGTVGSETEADCVIAAGTFTCTTSGAIASGASVVYQLTLAVAPSFASANLVNTASITSAPVVDPNAANNTATDTDSVTQSADLTIAKTDSVDPVIPGQAFTYTLTATNNGPSDASTVQVSDTVPAQFTVTSVTSPAGSCGNAGNVVTCTRATFPAGGTWVITVSVTANLSATPGTYTDTATINASTTDPVPGNNSGSQDTTIIPSADLSIVKTDSADPVNPGTSFNYTIVVTNNGPSDASNLQVTDSIPAPAHFTITGIVASAGSCVTSGNDVTCNLGSLTSLSTWTITVSVSLDLTTPGGLYTDTANVTSATFDPNLANNAGSQSTIVLPAADLQLTKTDGVGSVTAGTSTTYTITIKNNGPSTAVAGVVVSDPIPAGTTPSESEADCSIAAGTFTCTTTVDLAPTDSVTYHLTLAVPPNYASPTLVNTATITSSPVAEVDPSNDSATDTDTVVVQGDLAITKTDGVGTVVAGTSTTYTITATNSGPSQIPSGVVLSDPIPAGTVGSESEPDCSIVASTFTCTTSAPIAVGGVVSYQLTLAVASGYALPTLANTASVTFSPATDPNPANNAATDTDAVTTSADLSITKSDGVASVVAGTSTTYTITVTNNGPSDVPAGVVIDDPIPVGTNPTESEPDCVLGASFTCTTTAPLAPGASVTYHLTLAIPSNTALVSLVNTASITSSPATDPNPANNSATDTDAVTTSADLSITKTDSKDPVSPGDTFDYTVTVTNNGPSDASTLSVTDSIPAPLHFSITGIVQSAGACGNVGNAVTCTLGSLAVSATWVITITVHLDPLTPGGLYTDTANVTSTTADPNLANNAGPQSTIVLPAVDMSVTKTDGVASIVAGTSTTYTITLTNNGPSAELPGAVVSDPIPAGTTGTETEPNCVIAGTTFTCTTTAPILPGGSVSYQLTLAVPSSYASPTLANTATITSTPVTETDPSNDSATDTDTVTAAADLAITKTDAPDPVVAGGNVTYTLTVTNNGPSDAAGVVATDTLPVSVVFVSATPSQGTCSQLAGVVTCPLGPLADGATATVSIVVTTTIDGSITDTATVSATPPDPVPGNNSATQDTTVTASADLQLLKTDGTAAIAAGTSTTYTVTLTNNGPSVEPAGVVITDPVPPGTVGSEAEADCTVVPLVVFTCTTSAPLASGASVAYQLTLSVQPSYAPATLSNTATITASPVPDPNAANDAATDTDAVGTSADLSITKTDAPDPVFINTPITYTITVTNNGPSDAVGVVVTDTLPGFTSFVSATPSQGSCSEAAGVITCSLGSLAFPGSATITVIATASVAGPILNEASVTSTTPDPDASNNDVLDATTVLAAADLSISKDDGVGTVAAGTSTTYAIIVTNPGPSDEPPGVVVSDTIPAGTTGSETEPDCAISGGVFTCTTSAILLAGGSVTYHLTLAIPAAYALPAVTNTASITSAPIPDPNPANNSATDVDPLTTSADLSITKTDAPDPVTVGATLTYTITVANAGPADATGVTVTDTLPAGVTFVSATPSQGTCSQAAGIVTCPIGTIAASGSATIAVVVTPTVAGSITNTATVSATTPDPLSGNNSATQGTTVGGLADLGITKTDGVVSVTPGSSTTYTITVTNLGPSSAPAGVVVNDPIPSGTTGTTTSPECIVAAGTLTCTTTAALASGASIAWQVTVAVPATFAGTTLTNTATITSSPVPDPSAANDVATDTDTVTPLVADLSITKTGPTDPVAPGSTFSYTILVSNAGPDVATTVLVTDPVPSALTVTGVSSPQGTCANVGNQVSCTLPTLAANATWTITVLVSVPADATSGTVINTATVAGVGDSTPANDTASQSTTIGGAKTGRADLVLTIVVDDPTPNEGQTITYTVLVTNLGPDVATNVVVHEMAPDGVTFVSSKTATGTYHRGTGDWDIGSLAPAKRSASGLRAAAGSTASLQIVATVDAGTAGRTIHNPASVTHLDQTDPTPENDADSAPITVAKASSTGGTSFTGFPGTWPFVAWLVLMVVGLASLAGSRRRRA